MREIKFRVWDIDDLTMRSCLGFDDIRVYVDGDIEVSKDKSILQQFTELKDIKKKEIYEGDIITTNWNKKIIGKVYWDNGFWGIEWNEEGKAYNHRAFIFEKEVFEVIGNIYENPELFALQKETAEVKDGI